MQVLDVASAALKRLHKAMDTGCGVRFSAEEVQALRVTSLGEEYEEAGEIN